MARAAGVVAEVAPFDFPAIDPEWMLGVTIACGRYIACSTSEEDPSVPVRSAELFIEAAHPRRAERRHGDKEAVDTMPRSSW